MVFTKRNFIAATVAALLMGTAGIASAQEKLVISTANPPQHLQTLALKWFADELEARSKGELKSQIFDSGSLFNARDVGKAVARGDAGMAMVPSPYLSSIEANINVLDLPMLSGLNEDQRNAMLDGELGQKLSAMLNEKMGVIIPGNWPLLGRVMYWSTKKPLTNFDQFKGMQMRIPGGAAASVRMEAMGAIPVVMPGSDMPLALQQGTVDATMGSIESIVQQKLTDVGVAYGFWDKGIIGYLIPIVSSKYWNSLSSDQQALFTQVWNETVVKQRNRTVEQDSEYRQTLLN
ncbi:MAG: TRAP transporter substrate-binding protein DctP [Ahrensia sp.]|nr:TRAP transporter substrate-binding protein DctP [Ahrensia sp.]